MKKLQQKKGMYLGVANEDYHANRNIISKSWLDRVAISPLHLRQYLDQPHEQTLALTIGSAVDCLVFEPEMFDKLFVKSPMAKKTTIEGKKEWADAIANAKTTGRIIVECHLTNHWDAIHLMAEAIQGNPLMRELLQDSVGQAVFISQCEVTGRWKKCKTDNYHKGSNTSVDLKTAVSASPLEFGRSIANYRYHVQDSYYSDIVNDVVGEKPRFLFAVIEKPAKNNVPDSRMMAFYELTESEKNAGKDTYLSDLSAIAFRYSAVLF